MKYNSSLLTGSSIEPESPHIIEEPPSDMRCKLWLFDRTDESIYQERGSIVGNSDGGIFTITVKNAFFETLYITEKILDNKVETTLSLKQQNNVPDELIKKQAGLEANLLLHKNFKICTDRSYKFKLWLFRFEGQ